ncbi:MAG: UDP-N-acetylmuramoyl-L-alanine--D-glutamate ligase [Terriglobia bacterium]
MTNLEGKRVLVVGLARSGRAAAKCFAQRGAEVTVTDLRHPWELQVDIPELLTSKIGMELGGHREETFLRQDLIVVSPGVPPELPPLEAARRQKIPVVPEVEAASWFLEARLAGITGSNGKTTTTALLGEMLKASGFPTFVGGNIGVPLISAVDRLPKEGVAVTELSSFQLETVESFRPRVAVLLNLTPNHLDRHPSFEAYVRAKQQIFRNQTAEDVAVLNADDSTVMTLEPGIVARKIFFSRKRSLPEGVFVSNGHIVYRVANLERVLLETREVGLRGAFNLENILAAAAAACALGADFEAVRAAVRGFHAVEHRLEFVREIRGVQFFNDSKATSVDAAAKALTAFDHGVHLILGGKDKGAPYAPLVPLLGGRARCAYLIGAAAERIARELHGAVELVHAGQLETAMRRAFERAVRGDTILLSPACSSFDQFQDYEHRGRVFKELAELLARETATAEAEAQKKEASARLAPVVPAAPLFEARPAEPPVDSRPRIDASGPGQTFESPAVPTVARQSGAEATETIPSVAVPHEVIVTSEPIAAEPLVEEEPGAEAQTDVSRSVEPPQPPETVSAREEAAPPAAEVKYPELLYVYEVSAEEIPYQRAGDTEAFPEPPADFEAIVEAGALEAVDDESLPFEVRVGARADEPRIAESAAGAQEPGGESQTDLGVSDGSDPGRTHGT